LRSVGFVHSRPAKIGRLNILEGGCPIANENHKEGGNGIMAENNCRVYACVNQKGGVGKTVSSTNLAIGLAHKGKNVLIVDLDSQASQTVSLGWSQPDDLPVTIATQLDKIINRQPIDPKDGILRHAEGVDLMPSSIELSGLEVRMVNATRREYILRNYLEQLKPDYDVIVLDCPPTLGMMTINALAAADRNPRNLRW